MMGGTQGLGQPPEDVRAEPSGLPRANRPQSPTVAVEREDDAVPGEDGLSGSDQGRLEYEAGLQLVRDYFVSNQTLGSIIITLASALLATSIALVDKVAPLDSTSADYFLFFGWGFLGLTILIGVIFLALGNLFNKSMAMWLQTRPQETRLYLQQTKAKEERKEDSDTFRMDTDELNRLTTQRENSGKQSICYGRLKDIFQIAQVVVLALALVLLGIYAGAATSDEPTSNLVIQNVRFVEDPMEPQSCIATIDLKLLEDTADLTVYTAVDDELIGDAHSESIQRPATGDAESEVCVPWSSQLGALPPGPHNVQVIIDKSDEELTEAVEEGDIDEVRSEAESVYQRAYPASDLPIQ